MGNKTDNLWVHQMYTYKILFKSNNMPCQFNKFNLLQNTKQKLANISMDNKICRHLHTSDDCYILSTLQLINNTLKS